MLKDANEVKLTRLEDYTPSAYLISSVQLVFELDPANTRVESRLKVRRNPAAANDTARNLVLDGEDIALVSVQINGADVAHRVEGNSLIVTNVPDSFTLDIVTTCAPDANTHLSGLYTSQGMFCTQCEAQGFRRITYFLDRPDVMAKYTVTLRADTAAYPVLLSNGNLVATRVYGGGKHEAVWEDPFPKPSYLFALVAGNLVSREQRVTSPRTGREHLLQVYVRAGDLDKTDHAMQSLVHSLVWDEQRFGLSLDLDRFMIVATGDFNMGAMENKGLNIFNTAYVLASPATATDMDFANIESVVGHEYFHNWTGNRVTCRDWFQLSLKEGLTVFRDQAFSEDMAAVSASTAEGKASARAVLRIENVRQLRSIQFPEDAGPMAHPVRPAAYSAIDNFYTATVYEKGAEVVRIYETICGREGFRKGMDMYFSRHDGQAVTCDDFAQAMADANPHTFKPHLEQFKRWYSQAGTPRLKTRGRYDAASHTYTLEVHQLSAHNMRANDYRPMVVPVSMGLLNAQGIALPLQLEGEALLQDKSQQTSRVLLLTEATQYYTFVNIDAPPVPSLLRGFSAPVVLEDGLSDAELLLLLAHDTDPFNQWEAGQRLMMNRLLAAVAQPADAPLVLDAPFVQALSQLLRNPKLDNAFKELALTLPAEAFVAEQLSVVNPVRIHQARHAMRTALAHALREDWLIAYDACKPEGAYSPDVASAGKRALRNLALTMLCESVDDNEKQTWQGIAYNAVKNATNMTDRFAALGALVMSHSSLADEALKRFYTLYQHEALVIDKWFALQASAPAARGNVLADVKQLMQHADFSWKNPNRARSVLASFCMRNPGAFHREDAAGYAFWISAVKELDAINPQLASRLARSLDAWKKLAEPYKSAAQSALKALAAAPLSPDTAEIIHKAVE
jgi:aminopeptidase N